MERKTLIVGGTGKTGRRVAERLKHEGRQVIITSRGGSPRFEWQERPTWDAQLSGVTDMYLTYSPDLAVPDAAPHLREFTALAVERGVRRIVLLSGRGEPQVFAAEQAVRECGAEFTILRSAFMNQNFSEAFFVEAIRAGSFSFPAADTREPFLDADDIADVALAALTQDRHVGSTYELTGPRLLSFEQAVELIAAELRHPVQYVPVSREHYADTLAEWMPRADAEFLAALFAGLLDGRNAYVTSTVQEVLGRPARDFSAFVQHAARSNVWAA